MGAPCGRPRAGCYADTCWIERYSPLHRRTEEKGVWPATQRGSLRATLKGACVGSRLQGVGGQG